MSKYSKVQLQDVEESDDEDDDVYEVPGDKFSKFQAVLSSSEFKTKTTPQADSNVVTSEAALTALTPDKLHVGQTPASSKSNSSSSPDSSTIASILPGHTSDAFTVSEESLPEDAVGGAREILADMSVSQLQDMDKHSLLEKIKLLDKDDLVDVIMSLRTRGRVLSADIIAGSVSPGVDHASTDKDSHDVTKSMLSGLFEVVGIYFFVILNQIQTLSLLLS
jgi:hypothetical protein